jgi:hypothetical protein
MILKARCILSEYIGNGVLQYSLDYSKKLPVWLLPYERETSAPMDERGPPHYGLIVTQDLTAYDKRPYLGDVDITFDVKASLKH